MKRPKAISRGRCVELRTSTAHHAGGEEALNQKINFSATCASRARLRWLVTIANDALRGLFVVGSPNQGWLKAFKNSPRSCTVTVSLIRKFFIAERSMLFCPCPRKPGKLAGNVRTLLARLIRASLRCKFGST